LEALQHGKGTVVTPHALRGYSQFLHHRKSLIVAEHSAQFATAVVTLLETPEVARELGAKGADIVLEHFSRAVFFRSVAETIQTLRTSDLIAPA
jgi:glycosyltransferase involved in cell wall biosynthesis